MSNNQDKKVAAHVHNTFNDSRKALTAMRESLKEEDVRASVREWLEQTDEYANNHLPWMRHFMEIGNEST